MEQTLIVLAIVLGAATYIGRHAWKKVSASKAAKAGPACRDCCH